MDIYFSRFRKEGIMNPKVVQHQPTIHFYTTVVHHFLWAACACILNNFNQMGHHPCFDWFNNVPFILLSFLISLLFFIKFHIVWCLALVLSSSSHVDCAVMHNTEITVSLCSVTGGEGVQEGHSGGRGLKRRGWHVENFSRPWTTPRCFLSLQRTYRKREELSLTLSIFLVKVIPGRTL